jgi:hypothetical protein
MENHKFRNRTQDPRITSRDTTPTSAAIKSTYIEHIPKGKLLKPSFQKVRPIGQKGKTGVSLAYFRLNPRAKSNDLPCE